jgi:hypothetical protein
MVSQRSLCNQAGCWDSGYKGVNIGTHAEGIADIAVPELALDGGEVAGLAHDALAHGWQAGCEVLPVLCCINLVGITSRRAPDRRM